MSKEQLTFEWRVDQDDETWPHYQDTVGMESTVAASPAHRQAGRWPLIAAVSLLLFLIAAIWLWRSAQHGLNQIEGELRSAVYMDFETAAFMRREGAASTRTVALHPDEPQPIPVDAIPDVVAQANSGSDVTAAEVELLALQDNMAAVRVLTQPQNGGNGYRQMRFYRYTSAGWSPTIPDATVWGALRLLSTEYFRFRFHQPDAAAVAIVAADIDAVYTLMRRELGLPAPHSVFEIEIDISVQNPAFVPFLFRRGTLRLPSPSLLEIDPDLPEADILAEWMLGPLVRLAWEEAMQQTPARYEWWPMSDMLQRWHMRQYSRLSATWYTAFTGWLYHTVPSGRAALDSICQKHRFPLRLPVFRSMPPTGIYLCIVGQEPRRPISSRIAQLPIPNQGDPAQPWSWEQIAVMETLLDCALATYGRERLPALIQGLHNHGSWSELIPSVFGVTPGAFEATGQACVKDYKQVVVAANKAE